MKIILPIKEHSTRLNNKNFRPFHDGLSLSEIKIRQLLDFSDKEDIIVVGDGDRSKALAETYKTGAYLCDKNHNHDFASAINYWFTEATDCFPGEDIMTTFVTSPLFDYYNEILKAWDDDHECSDSIFSASPFKHFVTDKKGIPLNFQYGYYHKTSDKLPEWFVMDWSCILTTAKVAKEAKYVIGKTPKVFSQPGPSINIDTKEDFELAQWYYQNKQ